MRWAPIALFALACASLAANADGLKLANPAATLCVKNGARVEMATADDGSQRGICVFPDGTRIDEWTYFRNKHRGHD